MYLIFRYGFPNLFPPAYFDTQHPPSTRKIPPIIKTPRLLSTEEAHKLKTRASCKIYWFLKEKSAEISEKGTGTEGDKEI